MTPQQKLELLTKPAWSTSDIAHYFAVSNTTANKERNRVAKKPGASVKFGGHLVEADKVLEDYNTYRTREIGINKDVIAALALGKGQPENASQN